MAPTHLRASRRKQSKGKYQVFMDLQAHCEKTHVSGRIYVCDLRIQSVEKTLHLYEKWNNIPHYTQTETNERGPCEPSLKFLVYWGVF